MPFNLTTGVFTPPAGATSAATGQVIQSSVWNTVHADISSGLTTVMQQLQQIPSFANLMARGGGCNIWQRGAGGSASITVAASSTVYVNDGFYLLTNATQACNVAAIAGISGDLIAAHSAQITRTSGQTGTGTIIYGYPFLLDEIGRFIGNKVTVSFTASTGANWSPAGGTFQAALYTGTGAVTKRLAGGAFTNEATIVTIPATLVAGSGATTFTGTSTVTVPTNTTQAELQLSWTPVGTAGAADILNVDNFILVTGTIPMPFEDQPFDMSLYQCRRLYQKTFPYAVAPAQAGGIAGALEAIVPVTNSATGVIWQFPVQMRITPTITTFDTTAATANWHNLTTGATVTATVDATVVSQDRVFISSATVAAASNLLAIHAQADAGI